MTFCPMTINRIHFITFETELKFEVYIKRVYKRIGIHGVNNNFFKISVWSTKVSLETRKARGGLISRGI